MTAEESGGRDKQILYGLKDARDQARCRASTQLGECVWFCAHKLEKEDVIDLPCCVGARGGRQRQLQRNCSGGMDVGILLVDVVGIDMILVFGIKCFSMEKKGQS
jgi:hypothetical protein